MRRDILLMTDLTTDGRTHVELTSRAAADAIVARRMWTAVAELLPQLNIRLHAIAGGGCEAGAQRSYLRGQYDLLTRELWEALQLPVPPEFATITASTEGREENMGEPEQVEQVETADETADETAEAGADAAAEGE